ncbi:MAG: phage tail protein [bacterium]
MGTRFYFPRYVSAPISPAYSSQWEQVNTCRWMTYPAKTGASAGGQGVVETSGSAPYDVSIYQYISDALTAQTISGTVRGQIRAYEINSDGDFCPALLIKVVSGDGSILRGTLLAYFPSALTSEFSLFPTCENRHFPPETALTPLTIQAGDRLVIELGVRAFNTLAVSREAGLIAGDIDSIDLPEDETTATAANPWIEFSHVFQFQDNDLARQIILNAAARQVSWLFDVDLNANGSVDYRWSNQETSWNGYSYSFRVISFSPLQIPAAEPGFEVIPPVRLTMAVDFHGNSIDGYSPSSFIGAAIVVRLIGSAAVAAELMAWRFKVVSAHAVDQVMILECQDWFTLHLEGDYPTTPLVSELFPADVMKADNMCVPIVYGTAYIPTRWISKSQAAVYVDADTFTVAGDQRALFSVGQFLLAHCGADGVKACWVQSYIYASEITTVNLTAASDDLTSNLTSVSTDHYLLGPPGVIYTISQARTPREVNFKTTYQSGTYTFKQDTVTGADGNSWRVMQLLCDDANHDGTNDANGFWGIIGKEIYDLPVKFSRSDLAGTTNPADIAASLLQSFGISSMFIDTDSLDAARSTFTARGLAMNVGLWYRMPREKLISKLFILAGMIPVYRDKIGFKVLTKTSQMTIDETMVIPGTFRINHTFTQKQKDSGYVTWQTADEPVDQVNKSLIAVKSSTDKRSDTTIEADWVLDSAKAQKCAKLALQRVLLRDRTITFTGTGRLLFLEPGDMITVNASNLGGESAGWDCMITRMIIRDGLLVDVEAIRFSDALDDWGDISTDTLVVSEANTDRGYSPLYQGTTDAQGAGANQITAAVIVGDNGEIKTSADPATSGGLVITNVALTGYNTSGQVRFQAIYGGSGQGNVTIGDYSGGKGIKWDQFFGTLTIKVNSSGGVTVSGGGDITLAGSDTNPGIIKFQGTNYAVEIGGDADGNRFLIKPNANNVVDCFLGLNGAWWGGSDARFRDLRLTAKRQSSLSCGDWSGAVNGAAVEVDGDINDLEPAITLSLWDKTAQGMHQYNVRYGLFGPQDHKVQDLGTSSAAWDDAYADDWYNVADFFFLDHRQENGTIVPVDDLAVICAIRPSGILDPRTGLEIIDDSSLPEWLLGRDKVSGKILYDPEGKPYLSLKAIISLCLGAIRQLDRKLSEAKQQEERRGESK